MTTQNNQSSHTIAADPPNWSTLEMFYINVHVGDEYHRPEPIGLAVITSKRWTHNDDGTIIIALGYAAS
ncbi:hypothetical protein JWR97_05080 [Pseudomonas cedrina subsp. fulgida]|nr:hypothetical protein [Pseudomonas cedrina subsp. fulgida]